MRSNSTNVCWECGEKYPLTPRYFRRNSRAHIGFDSVCQACRAPAHLSDGVRAKMLCPAGMKFCPDCEETKPATTEYFGRNVSEADGFSRICKPCRNAYLVERNAKNPERARASRKKWADANPDYFERYNEENKEALKEKGRRYYLANRERIRANSRAWYEGNRGRALELTKERRKRNPGSVALYSRNRRALLRAAEGRHDVDEVWQMVEDQDGLCAYCEHPLFGDFHVEHMMPVVRGGRNDWTNLAIACPRCNVRKNTKTAEEWMAVLGYRIVT